MHPTSERLLGLDTLAPDERRSVLLHVRGCRACRAVLVAERPEALFGLLVERPLPQQALERLSADVSAAVDELESSRTANRSRRVWWIAGSVAATLLVGLWLGLPLMRGPGVSEVAEALPTPAAPAAFESAPPAVPVPALPVRGLELLSSPGQGEVVDFAIGDAQVVMIFDKELDI